MSKTAYSFDPDTGVFSGSFVMEPRPEYVYPDMHKGEEFDHILPPDLPVGFRARWDGKSYLIEAEYPDLLYSTWVPGVEGQVWDGTEWKS